MLSGTTRENQDRKRGPKTYHMELKVYAGDSIFKEMRTMAIIKVLNPMIIVFILIFTFFTFCRSVILCLKDTCQDKFFRVSEKISC